VSCDQLLLLSKWYQGDAGSLIEDLNYTNIIGGDKLIWYTDENNRFNGEATVSELLKRLEPVLKMATELEITLILETELYKNSGDPDASVKLLKQLFTHAGTKNLACNFAANVYVAGEEPFPFAYKDNSNLES
jgi:hypothetical protein